MMTAVQEELLPTIAGIMPKVDSLLVSLNNLVADPALKQSIARLDGITSNVYAASNGLNGTMRTINGSVPGIMGNVSRATVQIDSLTRNLAVLSSDLRNLPIQPTMDNVNRITSNLEAFSRQLNSTESTIGRLNNDPELYNRLNAVSADIDSLIVDIKRNPKRYISIKLL